MLPIHKICDPKSLNDRARYIIVKNQKVHVCDGIILMILPTKYVFGEIEFKEDEVLCFDSKLWQDRKFHKARILVREDNNVFKNPVAGTEIVAKAPDFSVPDFESVTIPKEWPAVPTPSIGVNIAKIALISEALGLKINECSEFILQFYGPTKAIEVLHPDFEDCYFVFMPCVIGANESLLKPKK